ncbi:basic leucine zipper and W2 domain-containing protein kra [Dermatophagoides farinae]|uniref:Basic leucine zipper and W2 domain-containing protein 2 n=1 Tax=Dermatophagoides farinae TaxID=6954 RepID=A0A922HN17_DERFA|nr:protein krasavietz-like [Dermatophagoides farinae]XP_046909181.1 protein krasavietz-like [Dermatophagoides farinae]KAH7639933.1 eif4-gamma-like protein [Dermatophagoides farinae]KAH9491282.1 Basic leucine zipper and W2 domain-containing protein 2 [Dermatophagoides farinae]KAH9491283.1 Basic leucine zipper and W2 domain-containing protein 2, variant 2 [Dermatophagoides farinae]KAH9491284.1 Basic leucine zipper and W2 domain-containing protein 2, variant 3 [Dermatophagoides farinae]KAH949128
MNQKAERPTLQGQRIKTRKRDEKEKFDPQGFRDSIILGIKETNGDLDQLSKFLDISGSKLDYRRYGESLCDILIAGGLLAPGGSILTDNEPEQTYTEYSVFGRPSDDESVKQFVSLVFVRLIRRYKYLEKSLEEDLKKIVVFLRAFTADDRLKLAKLFAYLLASGHISVAPLKKLLEQDLLIKEGFGFEFLLQVLQSWQNEKDASTVWTALRKSGLDSKLLDFLPKSKRNQDTFSKSMLEYGLQQLLAYQEAQRVETLKKELSQEIQNQINENGSTPKELIGIVKDYMTEYSLTETEVIVILWNTLMSMVEWNKKEELVADQAMKHLRVYIPLFAEFTKTNKAEMSLMLRIQDYCYENMNFLKAFQKIIFLFYKNDVISEDVILRWYKKDHLSKGKSIFLEQMKKFIDWLMNAEEEESEEE